MAHSKALEAYLLLEKVREIAAAIPCDAWPLEEIDDAIVGALDAVWHNAISTEDRAWLDGRKDDGAESQ